LFPPYDETIPPPAAVVKRVGYGNVERRTKERWVAWFKELGASGHIKDPGHPLEGTGKVVSGSQKIVKDGPYAGTKEVVGGYTIVTAKDIEEAVELSKGCPILEVGGSVEVRPVQIINM